MRLTELFQALVGLLVAAVPITHWHLNAYLRRHGFGFLSANDRQVDRIYYVVLGAPWMILGILIFLDNILSMCLT